MSLKRSSLSFFAVALSTLAFASNASARPKPSVTWTSSLNASAGQVIPVSWSSKYVGGAKLVIQRPVGTAKVWKSALKLNGRTGSAQLPALSLGKYRYRLAALEGARVIAQQIVKIRAFGEVPLSTLFGAGEHEHVYTAPTFSFPYVGWWDDSVERSESERNTVLQVKNNHCLSIHIAFVPTSRGNSTLSLVQETRDPVTASAPMNTIGSLDADLVPGQSWAVTVAPSEAASVDFNGFAVCDSSERFEGTGT
jgi:hypothetical protein